MTVAFPRKIWGRVSPIEVGLDPAKLRAVHQWQLKRAQDSRYAKFRTVIVRGGRVAARFVRGLRRGCPAHLGLSQQWTWW
jgi:hypothetical protein